jgi:hydrogenase maturation protein HypF
VALAQLWATGLSWSNDLPCVAVCPPSERRVLQQQLERSLNCKSTSSMGRLFDAVASMIGVRHEVYYEAQAAMEMESLATSAVNGVDPLAYRFSIEASSRARPVINPGSLLEQVCADIVSGIEQSRIAAQFHHAVANMTVEVCRLARQEYKINTVGLTGGVFQNVLLLRLTKKRLSEEGFDVLTHSIVPPNDGGIALGQAIVTRQTLSRGAGMAKPTINKSHEVE